MRVRAHKYTRRTINTHNIFCVHQEQKASRRSEKICPFAHHFCSFSMLTAGFLDKCCVFVRGDLSTSVALDSGPAFVYVHCVRCIYVCERCCIRCRVVQENVYWVVHNAFPQRSRDWSELGVPRFFVLTRWKNLAL